MRQDIKVVFIAKSRPRGYPFFAFGSCRAPVSAQRVVIVFPSCQAEANKREKFVHHTVVPIFVRAWKIPSSSRTMPVVAQAALGAMPPSVTVANEGRSKRKVSRPERFNSPPPAKRCVVHGRTRVTTVSSFCLHSATFRPRAFASRALAD